MSIPPEFRPFRLKVLDGVCAVLKTIAPTNDYFHDLTDYADPDNPGVTRERVFRGRDGFGFNDPRPMLSVLEDPAALEPTEGTGSSTSSTGGWRLLVQGFVEDDPEHPTDPAHVLVAEVIKALAREKRVNRENLFDLGDYEPCVTKISIGSPVVRPADDEISQVAFFFLPITLTLVEDREQPFSQP